MPTRTTQIADLIDAQSNWKPNDYTQVRFVRSVLLASTDFEYNEVSVEDIMNAIQLCSTFKIVCVGDDLANTVLQYTGGVYA